MMHVNKIPLYYFTTEQNSKNTLIFNDKDVQCYIINCDPWFRGKAAATILEYANTKNAI